MLLFSYPYHFHYLDLKLPFNPTSVVRLDTKSPSSSTMAGDLKNNTVSITASVNPATVYATQNKNDTDDSDSSTPHQVDEENDDDNSLAMIADEHYDAEDSTLPTETTTDVKSASSVHRYYNISDDKSTSNNYYNEIATKGLPEDRISIDPNDYESMYSIRRELDKLKESSSEVSDKIDSLGSKTKKRGKISFSFFIFILLIFFFNSTLT